MLTRYRGCLALFVSYLTVVPSIVVLFNYMLIALCKEGSHPSSHSSSSFFASIMIRRQKLLVGGFMLSTRLLFGRIAHFLEILQ
jgi:hypothetical protein